MRMEITLKSGAVVLTDTEEVTIGRGSIGNNLERLGWTTPADWSRKLTYVALDEIAAVVAIQEAGHEG